MARHHWSPMNYELNDLWPIQPALIIDYSHFSVVLDDSLSGCWHFWPSSGSRWENLSRLFTIIMRMAEMLAIAWCFLGWFLLGFMTFQIGFFVWFCYLSPLVFSCSVILSNICRDSSKNAQDWNLEFFRDWISCQDELEWIQPAIWLVQFHWAIGCSPAIENRRNFCHSLEILSIIFAPKCPYRWILCFTQLSSLMCTSTCSEIVEIPPLFHCLNLTLLILHPI